MEEIKGKIRAELGVKGEFVDVCGEIYNSCGYEQKDVKCAPTVLGHAGEIAILLAMIKESYPLIFTEPEPGTEQEIQESKQQEEEKKEEKTDKKKKKQRKESKDKSKKEEPEQTQVEEEPKWVEFNDMVFRLLDLYLMKSAPFYFAIQPEVFEQIKAEGKGIVNSMEDIWKVEDEESFKNIVGLIIQSNFNEASEPSLPIVCDCLNKTNNTENFKEFLMKVLSDIFGIVKNSTDYESKNKIKFFMLIEPLNQNYFAVCDINQPSVNIQRSTQDVLNYQLMCKKNQGKKDAKGRPYFEPFHTEKTFVLPLRSDNMRIMAINSAFSKIFRSNFLNCLTKQEVLFNKEMVREDKENSLGSVIDGKYNAFIEEYKKKVEAKYKMDFLELPIDPPAEAPNSDDRNNKSILK